MFFFLLMCFHILFIFLIVDIVSSYTTMETLDSNYKYRQGYTQKVSRLDIFLCFQAVLRHQIESPSYMSPVITGSRQAVVVKQIKKIQYQMGKVAKPTTTFSFNVFKWADDDMIINTRLSIYVSPLCLSEENITSVEWVNTEVVRWLNCRTGWHKSWE